MSLISFMLCSAYFGFGFVPEATGFMRMNFFAIFTIKLSVNEICEYCGNEVD